VIALESKVRVRKRTLSDVELELLRYLGRVSDAKRRKHLLHSGIVGVIGAELKAIGFSEELKMTHAECVLTGVVQSC
jgi:hypothetical protein